MIRYFFKNPIQLGRVAHVFNASTQEAEAGDSECEDSLVHIVSSRPVSAADRDPVSKTRIKTNKMHKKWGHSSIFLFAFLLMASLLTV